MARRDRLVSLTRARLSLTGMPPRAALNRTALPPQTEKD
jgi:hypothetical protein